MGLQAEFNWYLVMNKDNIIPVKNEDYEEFVTGNLSIQKRYHMQKDDYRVYPIDTPLPLIYNGNCIALAMVTELSWKHQHTLLEIQPVLLLTEDDPVKIYYEDSFRKYKEEQEKINDGGKIDLRSVVNPQTRRRIKNGDIS